MSSERRVVADFNANPTLKELIGHRTVRGSEQGYIARPFVVKTDCLGCHGDPKDSSSPAPDRGGAPREQRWTEGKTVAATIFYVPVDDLCAQYAAVCWAILSILAVVAVVLLAAQLRPVCEVPEARRTTGGDESLAGKRDCRPRPGRGEPTNERNEVQDPLRFVPRRHLAVNARKRDSLAETPRRYGSLPARTRATSSPARRQMSRPSASRTANCRRPKPNG